MSPRVSTRLLATQSDQRLLELTAKGHERAFEALVHRYRRPLLSYCQRLGLADSRGEDVLQQSLLKAWLSLQAGTEVRELRPWLYRIVHNTAVNVIRSAPESRGIVLDSAILEGFPAQSQVDGRIAAREALTEVAALPPMQREAILMSAIDGRSHEEVASALGISNGAVRGLLYRARATLRSAAAAITPAPLVSWLAGSASRVTPTAATIAALSGGGGGELGGTLLKGAALAVTAALAAGAVLVPLKGPERSKSSGAATARRSNGPHASASASALALVGSRAPAAGLLSGSSRQRAGGPMAFALGPLGGHRRSSTEATTHGGAPSGGSTNGASGTTTAPASRSTGTAGAATGRVAGTPSGPTLTPPPSSSAPEGATPAGSEGKGAPEPPGGKAPEPPRGDDGGAAPPTERERAEREAEAARELREREAARREHEAEVAREHKEREEEIAREKAEREAEAARELREREAEAAREKAEAANGK